MKKETGRLVMRRCVRRTAMAGILSLSIVSGECLPLFADVAYASEVEETESQEEKTQESKVTEQESSKTVLPQTAAEETSESSAEDTKNTEEQETTEEKEEAEEQKTTEEKKETEEQGSTEDNSREESAGDRTDSQVEETGNASSAKVPEATETPASSVLPETGNTGKDTQTEEKLTEKERKELEEEKRLADADDSDDDGESNRRLIARQKISRLSALAEDFRFWTVSRVYGFAINSMYIREEKDISSRKVGKLTKGGLLYILQTEEDGWYYVESGTVRGFVQQEDILVEDEAEALLQTYQQEAKNIAARKGMEYTGIDIVASVATPLINPGENEAFTYLRATVQETLIDKVYALANTDEADILEEKNTEARAVGRMKKGALCYVITDEDSDWVYVESGDVRGFVKREYLDIADASNDLAKEIEDKGENSYAIAKQLVSPKQNKALYYTLTSVKSASRPSNIREELLQYAAQFKGNAYKWGGTSLTKGIDCSAFTRAIYAKFGYSLPRTSNAQSQSGTKIAVKDAQPGDLIFYAKQGKVCHVAIYAGNGRTIEAANEELGITSLNAFRKNAVWAVHMIKDTVSINGSDIEEENTTEEDQGDFLGTFKVTYYSTDASESDSTGTVDEEAQTLIEGTTLAVNEDVAEEGDKVILNGHEYTVTNTYGGLADNEVAIYLSSQDKADSMDIIRAQLYMAN